MIYGRLTSQTYLLKTKVEAALSKLWDSEFISHFSWIISIDEKPFILLLISWMIALETPLYDPCNFFNVASQSVAITTRSHEISAASDKASLQTITCSTWGSTKSDWNRRCPCKCKGSLLHPHAFHLQFWRYQQFSKASPLLLVILHVRITRTMKQPILSTPFGVHYEKACRIDRKAAATFILPSH